MARADRTRWGTALRALALALLSSGCFGGQTGQESREIDPAPCKTAQPRSIGLDEDTPLGYRARDIIAETVFGEHLPFDWYRPETSRTQVRVSFRLDLDSVRWVSSDQCPGFIEFDAEVRIATHDLKVEATFQGVLKMTGAQDASFSAGVPIAEVRGTFDADDVVEPQHYADPELRLQLWIDHGEVRGQLMLDGRDPNPNDRAAPASAALGSF